MNILDKIVKALTWRTSQVAQLALFFAMSVIVVNIILRGPWKPVPGSVELVEMAGAVLLGMGVAYTAIMKGHIAVGILVDRFSHRTQAAVDIVVSAISLFFISILARELFIYAVRMGERGYQTGHLGLPMAPSIYLVAFGFAILALVLLRDLLGAAVKVINAAPKISPDRGQDECGTNLNQELPE